jgi:hypothetical protein
VTPGQPTSCLDPFVRVPGSSPWNYSAGLQFDQPHEFSHSQNYGLGNTLCNNPWNPVVHSEVQTWDFNNCQSSTGVSGTASMTVPAFTRSNSGNTDLGTWRNVDAQDNNHSIPGHNGNLEALNASVIGNHPLDILSMGVGQAAYERLMSGLDDVSQQEPWGYRTVISGQTLSTNLFPDPGPSPQPGSSVLSIAEGQSLLFLESHAQDFQNRFHLAQGSSPGTNQPSPPQQSAITVRHYACSNGNCTKVFRRKSDHARHIRAVHGINRVQYFCHVQGCPKSQGQGRGYSRDDKLTEHLWKKHRNLGYSKSR